MPGWKVFDRHCVVRTWYRCNVVRQGFRPTRGHDVSKFARRMRRGKLKRGAYDAFFFVACLVDLDPRLVWCDVGSEVINAMFGWTDAPMVRKLSGRYDLQ